MSINGALVGVFYSVKTDSSKKWFPVEISLYQREVDFFTRNTEVKTLQFDSEKTARFYLSKQVLKLNATFVPWDKKAVTIITRNSKSCVVWISPKKTDCEVLWQGSLPEFKTCRNIQQWTREKAIPINFLQMRKINLQEQS